MVPSGNRTDGPFPDLVFGWFKFDSRADREAGDKHVFDKQPSAPVPLNARTLRIGSPTDDSEINITSMILEA